jgi:16S rRNA (adenine1518-N6/adenine1519-N6)-dimethyltransferase
VVAIERDARCLSALAEVSAKYPERLAVFEGDAMEFDPAEHLTAPYRIIANLPYNIGTELFVRWMTPPAWPPTWSSLTLMFQREVAERICAKPGSSAWGRLAVLAQWRAEARIAFEVSPKAFTPPPKIWSAVVHVTPLATPRFPARPKALEHVTKAAFGQRRKMLRQSLKQITADAIGMCEAAGVEPTLRAEALDIADFCALARAFDAQNAVG